MILTKTGWKLGDKDFELNLLVLGRKKALDQNDVVIVKNIVSDILFGKKNLKGLRFLEGIKNGENVRLEKNEENTIVFFNGTKTYDGDKAKEFISEEFPFDEKEFRDYFLTFDGDYSFSWLNDKQLIEGSFLSYLKNGHEISFNLKSLKEELGETKEIKKLDNYFKRLKDQEFNKCLADFFANNDLRSDELVKDIERINEQIYLSEERNKFEKQLKKIDSQISNLEEEIKEEEKKYKKLSSSLRISVEAKPVEEEEKEIQDLKGMIPDYEKLEEKENELSKVIASIDELRNKISLIKREKKSLDNVVLPNKKILDSYDPENDKEILRLEDELGQAKKLREDIKLVQSLLVMVDNLAEACEEEEGLYWQAKEDKDYERAEETKIIWKNDEKERKETEALILNLLSPFLIKDFSEVRSILPKKIVQLEKDYNSLNDRLQILIEKRNRKEYAAKVLYYHSIKFQNLTRDSDQLNANLALLLKKENGVRKEITDLSKGRFISKQDLKLSIEAKESKVKERKKNLSLIKDEFNKVSLTLNTFKEELKSLQKLKKEILSSLGNKEEKNFEARSGKTVLQEKEKEFKKLEIAKQILDSLISLTHEKDKFLRVDIDRFNKVIGLSKLSLDDENSWNSSIKGYFLEATLNDISKHLTHIYKEKRELCFDGKSLTLVKGEKEFKFDELKEEEKLVLYLAVKLRFEKQVMKVKNENRRNYFFVFTSLSHKDLNASLKAMGLREFPLIMLRTVK